MNVIEKRNPGGGNWVRKIAISVQLNSCTSLCLFIHLFDCISIFSIHLFIYLATASLYLSGYPFCISVSIWLSILYFCVYLSIQLSIHLSIHLSTVSICLSLVHACNYSDPHRGQQSIINVVAIMCFIFAIGSRIYPIPTPRIYSILFEIAWTAIRGI